MIRENLSKKHITVLKEYGLDSVDLPETYVYKYNEGEYLLTQGHEITYLFIILSGKLKVIFTALNGRQLLLSSYDSGIISDIEFMLGDYDAKSSVRAITRISVIGIPLKRYDNKLKDNITFMNKIGEALAQKLNQSSRNNSINILNSLEARLCSYIMLTNLDGYFAEKKTEVSEILGTSYRHLLRTFDRLCDKGVLKKEDKGYKICDSNLLNQIGDDYIWSK